MTSALPRYTDYNTSYANNQYLNVPTKRVTNPLFSVKKYVDNIENSVKKTEYIVRTTLKSFFPAEAEKLIDCVTGVIRPEIAVTLFSVLLPPIPGACVGTLGLAFRTYRLVKDTCINMQAGEQFDEALDNALYGWDKAKK